MFSTTFTFKVKTIVNYLLITLSSCGQLKQQQIFTTLKLKVESYQSLKTKILSSSSIKNIGSGEEEDEAVDRVEEGLASKFRTGFTLV